MKTLSNLRLAELVSVCENSADRFALAFLHTLLCTKVSGEKKEKNRLLAVRFKMSSFTLASFAMNLESEKISIENKRHMLTYVIFL